MSFSVSPTLTSLFTNATFTTTTTQPHLKILMPLILLYFLLVLYQLATPNLILLFAYLLGLLFFAHLFSLEHKLHEGMKFCLFSFTDKLQNHHWYVLSKYLMNE